MMTVDQWLRGAVGDAERRQIPEVVPLLEKLAKVTARLRAADWNLHADDPLPEPETDER
jgi:hypothetical protein